MTDDSLKRLHCSLELLVNAMRPLPFHMYIYKPSRPIPDSFGENVRNRDHCLITQLPPRQCLRVTTLFDNPGIGGLGRRSED